MRIFWTVAWFDWAQMVSNDNARWILVGTMIGYSGTGPRGNTEAYFWDTDGFLTLVGILGTMEESGEKMQ